MYQRKIRRTLRTRMAEMMLDDMPDEPEYNDHPDYEPDPDEFSDDDEGDELSENV